MNIFDAASEGNLEELKKLLQQPIDWFDSAGSKDSSALHFAADNGHLECVQALIESGANVNFLNADDQTPLHWAAGQGHLESIKALLNAGAYFSVEDSMNQFPIDIAILYGKTSVVQHLLQVEVNHHTGRPWGKKNINKCLMRYLQSAEAHQFPTIVDLVRDQISLVDKAFLQNINLDGVKKRLPKKTGGRF